MRRERRDREAGRPTITTRPREDLDVLFGRRPVLEALRSNREVVKLYIETGLKPDGIVRDILDAAAGRGLAPEAVAVARLDSMSREEHHQGVLALAMPRAPVSLDNLLEARGRRDVPPLVIVLDGVEDPQNLGAVLRIADGAGAAGVVVPSRGAAGLGPGAVRASAGAIEHVRVASVPDLGSALARLKREGFRIAGADAARGRAPWEVPLAGPVALVMGSEGRGLSPETLRACDVFVKIPLRGALDSLNVSTATSVLAFEKRRQDDAGAKAPEGD
ncbi:MAG: 23S rRNA (guanosine(2251)-2'-O)-methyltransferase RlmB [Thermoplasmatota archaeon]